MPQAIMRDPTPAWLKHGAESVTDSNTTKALRALAKLIGANDPTSQVMGVMTSGTPAGEGGVLGMVKKAIKAYHGSPYDFDKFDMGKIGTGEGAQAFGHGGYMAGVPDTARVYRDMVPVAERAAGVRPDTNMRIGGRAVTDVYADIERQAERMPAKAAEPLYERLSALESLMQHGDALGVQEAANAGQVTPAALAWFEKDVAPKFTRRGKLYEVNIHADPEDFLDWDKPLSQQSEKVRASAGRAPIPVRLEDLSREDLISRLQSVDSNGVWTDADNIAEFGRPATHEELIHAARSMDLGDYLNQPVGHGAPYATGQSLYRQLTTREGGGGVSNAKGQMSASDQLKAMGIPGIKYLDQGSRSAGEGSRNYVVFDDALVEILKKWGLMPGAVAGGYASQQQQEKR